MLHIYIEICWRRRCGSRSSIFRVGLPICGFAISGFMDGAARLGSMRCLVLLSCELSCASCLKIGGGGNFGPVDLPISAVLGNPLIGRDPLLLKRTLTFFPMLCVLIV